MGFLWMISIIASVAASPNYMDRFLAFHSTPLPCKSSTAAVPMTKSPNELLRKEILEGAALKVTSRNDSDGVGDSNSRKQQSDIVMSECADDVKQYTYYVREASRSEINEITNVLMTAFHPQSTPLFDSYIQRYKYNHLQACFNLPNNDMGLFVALAVSDMNEESIIGFCCVDGRPNDSSSRVEFLTASTLATTCPRPYLSDLGVLPTHRRNGIGQALITSCEQWISSRGYDRLYLKVNQTHKGTLRYYKSRGYVKSVLPSVRASSGGKKWDNDVLLEKKIGTVPEVNRKKNWLRYCRKGVNTISSS